jgi:hypothetical protein
VLVVLGDLYKSWQGRITPAAQFSNKRVQDQLVMGQTEVEIYATAMPRPEGVTPRASGTGRARQNHGSGTVH